VPQDLVVSGRIHQNLTRRFGGFAAEKDTFKATDREPCGSMSRMETPPTGGFSREMRHVRGRVTFRKKFNT